MDDVSRYDNGDDDRAPEQEVVGVRQRRHRDYVEHLRGLATADAVVGHRQRRRLDYIEHLQGVARPDQDGDEPSDRDGRWTT